MMEKSEMTALNIQHGTVFLEVTRDHNSIILSSEGLGGKSSVVMSCGEVKAIAAFLLAAQLTDDFRATTRYHKDALE